jgi:hypothetical protein
MLDTSRIVEHMPVVGSDGQRLGTVDHLEGTDRIKLTRNDSPDGQHHTIPIAWVEAVDTEVRLGMTTDEARRNWQA